MTPFDYLLQRSQEETMTTANTVSPTLREPTPHKQISGSVARIAATLSCSICRRYLSHESKTT